MDETLKTILTAASTAGVTLGAAFLAFKGDRLKAKDTAAKEREDRATARAEQTERRETAQDSNDLEFAKLFKESVEGVRSEMKADLKELRQELASVQQELAEERGRRKAAEQENYRLRAQMEEMQKRIDLLETEALRRLGDELNPDKRNRRSGEKDQSSG